MIQKFGKYKIIDKIGAGAMGSVYRAYDDILDRHVTIKIMAEDIKWNPELKLRFYREARAAASLHHPNIVTVYDLGEEGKTTFIVMEYLQGKNLKEIIQQKISIPLEQKIMIMAQVCDGLNHAHRGGFIHRDIKPGNIFVTTAGTAKILDFGIARIPESNLTRIGDRLGTPIYMSPEAVRGEKYDSRSDIFSAGIVFYEFLTSVHPFRDAKFDKTIDNILYLEDLPFMEQFPEAPADLWPILKACLAKEPDKRYANMALTAAACRSLIEEIHEASQRMAKEVAAILPNLRMESQRPDAPAILTRLWAEAQDLLSREQKPDYLSLLHLTTALSEEPLLQPDATSFSKSIPGKKGPEGTVPEVTQKIVATSDSFPPSSESKPAGKEAAAPATDEQLPAQTLEGRMSDSSKDHPASPPAPEAETPEEYRQKEQQIVAAVEALLAQGRLDDALKSIRESMGQLGPTDKLVEVLSNTRRRIEERNRAHRTKLLNSAKEAIEQKQFSKAVEVLDKVLELEPESTDAIEMRRKALAEVEAERIRQTRREEGERAKAAGYKLLAEKKYRESLRAFRQATELLGEDTGIKVGMDEAEAEIKAEELLAKVQRELAQAKIQFQSGDLDGARPRANRVLELAPRNNEARDLLVQIDRAQEEKNKKDAIANLIAQGREAMNRRDFEEALSLVNEALEQDPANIEIQNLLQNIRQAKEDERKRQEIGELLLKAGAAINRQDFDEAEGQARAALAIIPDYPDAEACLKKIDQARQRQRILEEIEKALADAEQAFRQEDLTQCEMHARRALALDTQEKRATELLERVAEVRETRKREQIAVLLKRGEDAIAAEEFQEAENCANAVLQIEARHFGAEKLIADIGQAEEARKKAKIAEYLYLSREALAQGRFDTAAGLANEVLSLDAKHKEAKTLAKEIKKARRKSEKELGKQQKELGKADTAYSEAVDAEGDAGAGKTFILEPVKNKNLRRKLIRFGIPAIAMILIVVVIFSLVHRDRETSVPVDDTVPISEAKSFLDQKRYDKAIESAEKILRSFPNNGKAKDILAEAKKQKRESAIEVLMVEAQTLRELHLYDESLIAIQKILDLDPDYQAALEVRTQINKEKETEEGKKQQTDTARKFLNAAASLLSSCKLTDAGAEIHAVKSARDEDIQKRLAKVRSILEACNLEQAQSALDKAKRADRTMPELAGLSNTLAARKTEFSSIQADYNKWLDAIDIQSEIAELGAKATRLFTQAKYDECQEVINKWLSLASQDRQAQTLSAKVNEAHSSLKEFEKALAAKKVSDALQAVNRLEKVHPSNPNIAEYKQRAEDLRKSVKAILNVLRIGEAGSLMMDNKPIGVGGEVINAAVGIGSHTIGIKDDSGKQKNFTIELVNGTNQTYIYDLATMDFWPMTEADRERAKIRKEREQSRSFQVQHTHGLLRGSCSGDLVISGFRVEYRPNESNGHDITHSFENLTLKQNEDKIELIELPGNKKLATFKARNTEEAESIMKWWETLGKLIK